MERGRPSLQPPLRGANQTFQQRGCTPDPLQTLLLCLEEDLGASDEREGFSRGKEKGKQKRPFRWKGKSRELAQYLLEESEIGHSSRARLRSPSNVRKKSKVIEKMARDGRSFQSLK